MNAADNIFVWKDSDNHYVESFHWHRGIQLIYCISGSYVHSFGERVVELREGSLAVVPPNFPHMMHGDTANPGERYFCNIPESVLDSFDNPLEREPLFNMIYLEPILIGANVTEPYLHFSGEEANGLVALFDGLFDETRCGRLFSDVLVRGAAIRVLAVIAQKFIDSTTTAQRAKYIEYRVAMQHALDFINVHYCEKIYLEQVASIAFMSPRSFSYLFKKLVGSSYSEYVLNLRVNRACELLRSTDRTQYDICRSCGFTYASYYQRAFKRLTGELPGKYRLAHSPNSPRTDSDRRSRRKSSNPSILI